MLEQLTAAPNRAYELCDCWDIRHLDQAPDAGNIHTKTIPNQPRVWELF